MYDFTDIEVCKNVTELVDGSLVNYEKSSLNRREVYFSIIELSPESYGNEIGARLGILYYWNAETGVFGGSGNSMKICLEKGFCLKHPDLCAPETEYFYTGPIDKDGRIVV